MKRGLMNVIRGAAVLSVLGLIGVLLYYLPQPGYSQSRLILFALITSAALLGGAGVVQRRVRITIIGAAGLFLLGFWQAVLAVFIYPVIALLLLAASADSDREDTTLSV